ncbi:hypothetical protein SMG44B_40275 [Stenotrophomonas maltophilia]|nr:hypothetical protein BN1263110092 [Stenotrophomonas maltophilia]
MLHSLIEVITMRLPARIAQPVRALDC